MADQKVSDLPSLNGSAVDPADLLYIVDSSAGTAGSKKITIGQFQLTTVVGGDATYGNLAYTGTLTGGAGVVNIGSGQIYKDASGNVGVGTSSPVTKLDVVGIVQSNNGFQVSGNTTTINTGIWGTPGVLAFNTGSSERMRLDASGNLGLGVTPSAWLSSQKALEVSGWSVNAASLTSTLATNAYVNASSQWIYKATGFATRYDNVTGQHQWFTAPSGTAGNTISFTQAMTLDASGNLGVGTSSPGAPLDVVTNSSAVGFSLRGRSSDDVSDISLKSNSAATTYAQLQGRSTDFRIQANSTVPMTFYTNGTEKMRLDSSGNLGLGKTPEKRLDVLAAVPTAVRTTSAVPGSPSDLDAQEFWVSQSTAAVSGLTFSPTDPRLLSATVTPTNEVVLRAAKLGLVATDYLVFWSGANESARITSGGSLLVGATSNAEGYKQKLVGSQVAATLGVWNNQASGNFDGQNIYFGGSAPNNGTSRFMYCNDTVATRLTLISNGGIANYQANDVNLSDRREKTNFAPAKSYLDTICAIPVQTFNYIDQNLEEDPGLTLGVVAQDVQAVAPELVHESNWGTEDNPKVRLSIYQTDMQYALMKCIQELKAELDATKARLAALEAA